jgi:methyl-accepting chemotaxis protein
MKKRKSSIVAKIIFQFCIAMFLLTSVVIFISARLMYSSSINSAVDMAERKMRGDLNSAASYVKTSCGSLSLDGKDLVLASGTELRGRYDIVDGISRDLGDVATIFVRDGEDFRRVITSIQDDKGVRAVGTMLGQASAAYRPIIEGKTYLGKATILGNEYVTGYAPIAGSSGDVIGILFVGVKMTDVNAMISDEVTRSILYLVIAAFGLLIASLTAGFFIVRGSVARTISSAIHLAQGNHRHDGDGRRLDRVRRPTQYHNRGRQDGLLEDEREKSGQHPRERRA